jgi:hypothetical protein
MSMDEDVGAIESEVASLHNHRDKPGVIWERKTTKSISNVFPGHVHFSPPQNRVVLMSCRMAEQRNTRLLIQIVCYIADNARKD